jgi:hypothetical protein
VALRSHNSVKSQRPARIRVPNRERVLFRVRDHRFVGILQRLSLTGGSVVHTEKPLPPGTLAALDLKTVYGKVSAKIEFLHMGADGNAAAQAFRFLRMDDSSTRKLSASIENMQDGYSDLKLGQPGLGKLVSQGLRTIRDGILRLHPMRLRQAKVRSRS